jgi:hypothetical protein
MTDMEAMMQDQSRPSKHGCIPYNHHMLAARAALAVCRALHIKTKEWREYYQLRETARKVAG